MRCLPPVGQQDVVGDPEQEGPEQPAPLVSRGALEDRDERVLRQLLGASGVGRPPAEKPPDRLAVTLEQRLERRPRALSNLAHQLFVAGHITAVIRVVSSGAKKLLEGGGG